MSHIQLKFLNHGFIGFGNMAKAIFNGLHQSIPKRNFRYFSKTNRHQEIQSAKNLKELITFSDVLWLGVKPQILEDVLQQLKNISLEKKIIVTMIAGKKIENISKHAKRSSAIIRIMPNLAIAYQKSVTAFCVSLQKEKNQQQKVIQKIENVKNCLEQLGIVLEIGESQFDTFTAIFGSGPAFFLELMKTFEIQAQSIIPKNKIKSSISMLINGTINYYQQQKKLPEMIAKITSKGGTTQAGLETFRSEKINDSMNKVIQSATQRSIDLSLSAKKYKVLVTIFDISSDHNFAKIIEEIEKKYPNIFEFSVYGGEKLKKRKVNFLEDTVTKSRIGFLESISSILPSLFFFRRLKKKLKNEKYDLVLCLDGQGFNLVIGKIAKKLGLKTMYYFPPLLFVMPLAKKKMKYFDKILCPFEKNYCHYQKYNLPSQYTGHPFSTYTPIVKKTQKVIGIFPGSRWQEVKKLTPLFLQVAEKMIANEKFQDYSFKIAVSHSDYLEPIKQELVKYSLQKKIEIVTEKIDNLIQNCHFMICCSGSVTLKASFFHVPHLLCYRISKLTYWIAKKMTLIKYIGMLNILAGKEIAPELINQDATLEKIYWEVENILTSKKKYQKIKQQLESEVSKIRHPNPFVEVADAIFEMVKSK